MNGQNGKQDTNIQELQGSQNSREEDQGKGLDRSVLDEQGRGGIPSGHEADTGDGEEENDPGNSAEG